MTTYKNENGILVDTVIDSPTFVTQYNSPLITLDDSSGTIAIDWDDGNVQYFELTGTGRTVTFSHPNAGARYVLIIKQAAAGSKTITTWPTIKWQGGSAPTLTATGNRYDIISLIYDGTNYYGSIVDNFY